MCGPVSRPVYSCPGPAAILECFYLLENAQLFCAFKAVLYHVALPNALTLDSPLAINSLYCVIVFSLSPFFFFLPIAAK